MIKQVFRRILNGISIAIILCALGILLTVVLTPKGEVPSIFGYTLFRVMTGSMEPAIQTDSLIIVKKTDVSEIMPGDIISFFSQDPSLDGAVNTHRVVSVEETESGRYFVTKGDMNSVQDQYLTSENDVIGKVIFTSHALGVAVHLLSNPLIFITLIVIPLFVILFMNLIRTIRYTKRLMKEEEEAAVREAIEEIRKKSK